MEVGPEEMSAMRRLLRQHLGQQGKVSDRYLRDVVEQAGVTVAASLGGLPPDLLKLLKFQTLYDAEQAIWTLESHRQAGRIDEARQAARRAREGAELVARNPRVRPLVRQEHEEIAQWFQIWLQTPDVFPSWLEVRMASQAFAERFLL